MAKKHASIAQVKTDWSDFDDPADGNPFNLGDRVQYVGSDPLILGLDLTVAIRRGMKVTCWFPEHDRPGGRGLTGWIAIEDVRKNSTTPQ